MSTIEDYVAAYNKTLHDVRNKYQYNFLDDVITLTREMDLASVDSVERGGRFYNILRLIGSTNFEFSDSHRMGLIYQIMHEEILQLGEEKYTTLITSLNEAYPNTFVKMLVASPFVEGSTELFGMYNADVRFTLIAAYLKFQSIYKNTIDISLLDLLITHLKTDLTILSDVCEIVYQFGPYKDPYDQFALYKKYRAQLHSIIDAKYPPCANDAYADSIAVFIENPMNISAEMRATYSYWCHLKYLGYRLTIIHNQKDFNINTMNGLFNDALYLPDTFNVVMAKSLLSKRYRVVFYVSFISAWSLFLSTVKLGMTQVGILGHTITSGLPSMDYYLTAEWDKAELYTEKVVPMYGMGCTMTTIVPHLENKMKKNTSYTYLYCPWGYQKINHRNCAVLKQINTKLKAKKINPIFVFYAMSAKMGQYKYTIKDKLVISKYIDNFIIPHEGLDEYYELYSLADVVLAPFPYSSFVSLIDGLLYNKPTFVMDDESSHYAVRHAAKIMEVCNLKPFVSFSDAEYITSVVKFLTTKKYKDTMLSLVNNIDIEEISREHNKLLNDTFNTFCLDTLELEDRSDPPEKVKITPSVKKRVPEFA